MKQPGAQWLLFSALSGFCRGFLTVERTHRAAKRQSPGATRQTPTRRLARNHSVDDYESTCRVTAAQFTILTCASTSCAKRRTQAGLDDYATLGALAARASGVTVEESPCLGGCQLAPCVAVAHEDYEGTVALVGMTTAEFAARTFHRVLDENDADRVWESVAHAIDLMAAEEAEGERDDAGATAYTGPGVEI
jgi:(2Fe-2S) ferredoxin